MNRIINLFKTSWVIRIIFYLYNFTVVSFITGVATSGHLSLLGGLGFFMGFNVLFIGIVWLTDKLAD